MLVKKLLESRTLLYLKHQKSSFSGHTILSKNVQVSKHFIKSFDNFTDVLQGIKTLT